MPDRLLIVSGAPARAHEGKHYIQGGFGRHVDAFARRYEHVYLLTCVEQVDTPPDDYRLRAQNLTVVPISNKRHTNRLVRYVLFLRAALETAVTVPRLMAECDLVHARLPDPVGNTGALLSRFTSKPVFLYVAGDWEAALRAKGDNVAVDPVATLVQKVLQFLVGDRLCFTAGEAVARKFGGPSDTVIPVMTTAIDRSHVVSADAARRRAARQPREILFVGGIWEGKGVHVLLQALRELRATGVDARLKIIGETIDDGRWLDSWIRSLELDTVVTHQPHMAWDRLMTEYEESDVFVLPSIARRGEGVPKVVLEAMARGVPVVASDVGGVSTLVRHGENGLLVAPEDPTEIAQAVAVLWNDADLRARLVTQSVATARQYDLDSLIDSMVATVNARFRRTREGMPAQHSDDGDQVPGLTSYDE